MTSPSIHTRLSTDFIITGQQPWDVEIGSNCKNIALELSKKHRVLYVNSPLDRGSLLRNGSDPKILKRKRVIDKKENGLEQIGDNLWVLYPDRLVESVHWISWHSLFVVLNKRNNRIFADSILKAVSLLGFKDFVLFNDNDMFRSFYLKDFLKPSVSVYYSRDFMLAVDYWKKHGTELEPQLIAKSDVCVANSVYLQRYCLRYNPRSFYVGQGCDLSLFEAGLTSPVPAELSVIPGPRIGYVGALQALRLDIDLLKFIAKTRPDWQLIFVGPPDNQFQASDLKDFPNVHFTGSRDVSELPAYINAFDVCLNPQLLNEVTIGNYPRKIDEYLAMGKATVATRTEAMEVFEEHVYLAESKEDYVQLIEQALAEDNPARQDARRSFASQHTWENSVAEICSAIATVKP
ncbi:glycosyltransferase [Arundinibacter roseus]|uniref:Glycosyltransferase family 1 protein n=1 Tax=Arundinibacter roseus TaxID=2070510 RepID=A0A4R4JY45_9BACT|nr:glycosyltransferase [Arundinibacter roseus]TDB59800.1 glycosyltransferase family 1 protein [Arundinibacter roseus]